jgi:hypothetical protein
LVILVYLVLTPAQGGRKSGLPLRCASTALADGLTVGGHEVAVRETGMGSAVLTVDGEVLHENGAI